MSKYVGRCQRCGEAFRVGDRTKVAVMREDGKRFTTSGYARYYCGRCASDFKKAIAGFEAGGADA